MASAKYLTLLTLGLAALLVLAGCGSTTSSATSSPSAASSQAVVKTATISVKGTSQSVLKDAQGKTLYYYTPDTSAHAACGSGCTDEWPPLLYSGSGAPQSAMPLSGTLSVQNTGNGSQVEYNGHPLYTFKSDQDTGDAYGEGAEGGKWHVATPSLAQNS